MKCLTRFGGLVCLIVIPTAASAQGEAYVLRGGTVHTLAGQTIENGSVVIVNGRISAVGTNVPSPMEAQVYDVTGKHVYPGVFNAFSQLGLSEINSVEVTNDMMELGDFNPHLMAMTAVHPDGARIPVTRANGVTHVITAPSARPGGIGGQAAAISLDGWTIEEMLINGSVGMVLNWPSIQTRRFNFATFSATNRSFSEAEEEYDSAVERLRDRFAQAQRYRQAKTGTARIVRDLKNEAMVRVLDHEIPMLVLADGARDIRNAVAFSLEMGFEMVLVGGRDAWQEKELLAEHDIPVLVRATQNVPNNRDDSYTLASSGAVQLHRAGVRIAMTGWQSAGPNPPSRTVAYEAANAVKHGLTGEEALLSVTRWPAEILGLGNDLGTIETGKIGNVIVTNGDPLQIRTAIEMVFINGRPVSLDNKHKALYERYRARN